MADLRRKMSITQKISVFLKQFLQNRNQLGKTNHLVPNL